MTHEDFKNKYGPVALVTGASSGIGRCLAEQLAAKGMDLALVARRVERLDALASQLKSRHGIEVKVCPIDLAQAGAVRQIAQATASLDIGLVLSNAGFSLPGEHAATDPDALADMLMVNCHTPMLLTREFIPRLLKRGRGGIILTSSVEGLIGCPFSTAYSASKAFVRIFGEGLWGELTPHNIDVLVICPGATDTEALSRHGIDPATLPHLMSPEQVAALTLEHVSDGPVLVTSEHYKTVFDRLLSMPRRDALTAIANRMNR